MTAHDWYVENRAGFVARSLEPGEERTFRDHLVRCSECTGEVARLERELAGCRWASPRWRRRRGSPARWRPRSSTGPTAGAAGCRSRSPRAWHSWPAGAALAARHEGRDLRARLAARETQLAALEDTLSVLRRANNVLQTQISMNGHQGGLLIFQDAVSHRWCVIVHGLPPAPVGSMYQFWFITETGMVRSVEVDRRHAAARVHDPAHARRAARR